MSDNKSLSLLKRPSLTKGQKSLFNVFLIKIEKDEKMTFNEAKEIYISNACREVRDGIPYSFNFWWRNEKDQMVGRYEPMSESMIHIAVVMWLTHNIGSLVLKGYLKVLPVLELN